MDGAWLLPWIALALALAIAAWMLVRARLAQLRWRIAESERLAAQADALEARAAQEDLSRDLELLGSFGNLLIVL
jgi:ABC-type nickel/cobalt efflux system permease component RcnA